MIERTEFITHLAEAFEIFPIIILGPRQYGKTTLANFYSKQIDSNVAMYLFDLEDPTHLNQLQNPKTTLENLSDLVIIDEIQRQPEIFPYSRVFVDYSNSKFLILGSALDKLLKQSSESLIGSIDYIELTPFSAYINDKAFNDNKLYNHSFVESKISIPKPVYICALMNEYLKLGINLEHKMHTYLSNSGLISKNIESATRRF